MKRFLIPELASEWWTIASSPDLAHLNSPDQQPMDFGLWRAADSTWQLGACVRKTSVGGKGRLLFRWQSASLCLSDWEQCGILLQADEPLGEILGGLQSPFVSHWEDRYLMFYGDWVNICLASSLDGKHFERRVNAAGKSRLFEAEVNSSTRDPMHMQHAGTHFLYYTRVIDGEGSICARTSEDLVHWTDPVMVSGGSGCGPTDAECAFVQPTPDGNHFYLYQWDSRGITKIFCSDDPLDFGVGTDRKKIGELPLEVVRIINSEEGTFITSLHEDLTGIRLASINWV
ncbi:MAG: hypothetical protein ACI9W1_001057 [Candidatus Azotimanducaceae bacterium]|jgi:hypothetical protein